MEEVEIYEAALNKWGLDAQAAMTMGECGELIAEINRRFVQGRDNIDALVGEIADVEIMLGQMRFIFGDKVIDQVKRKKLNRLKSIIDGTVEHPHKPN